MKKLVWFSICVCMLTALCVMTAFAETITGECGESVTYTLDTDTGVLTISGEGEMSSFSSFLSIPWHSKSSIIKKVVIDNSVTSLSDYAFYNHYNLENVIVGKSVASIGADTFYSCDKLEDITVVSGNAKFSSINGVLFDANKTTLIQYPIGNTRTDYTIPPFVVTVDDFAFYESKHLKSVIISDGVRTVSSNAFEWANLDSIYIPASVTSIGTNAFRYNSSLTIYGEANSYVSTYAVNDRIAFIPYTGYCGDNVEYLIDVKNSTLTLWGTGTISAYTSGRNTPWANWSNITNIVVESGITYLPSYIFEYMGNVETIILPDTLQKLAYNAFNDCANLNNLILPASLVEFTNTLGFLRCTSLTDVYYVGTETDFAKVTNSRSANNNGLTIHYLVKVPSTATCTQAGTESYYAFDDTSVYDNKYNAERKIISHLETVPALGHTMEEIIVTAPTTNSIGKSQRTCTTCGHIEYEDIPMLEVVKGDLDGDSVVSLNDVLIVIDALLNGTVSEGADMNDDGRISLIDILKIMKLIVA